MEQFKHLTNLVVDDTKERKQRTTKFDEVAGLKGNVVRLYANGEVYPSKDLVDKFNLEYGRKGEGGNGFDVVDSTEWKPTEKLQRTIFFGVVSKDQPKVDLFAQVRYNEMDEPINSVRTQGTKSKLLVDVARSMGWLTDQKYVDLEVVTSYPVTAKDGISYVPKQVERGEQKGAKTYERRENVTFFPVTVINFNQVETTTQTNVEETTPTKNEVLINN